MKNKAHQYLIEHPNATWEQFKEHVSNKDLVFTISSQLAPNAAQSQKSLINELKEDINAMKNMLKEQQISSINPPYNPGYGYQNNYNPNYEISAVDINNTSRQNATRFCKYCQRNGHTIQYCRKKMHDDETRRIQSRNNEEKKVTFTNDYNKRKGPGFGSQQNNQPTPRPAFSNGVRFGGPQNSNFNRSRPNEPNFRNNNWNNRSTPQYNGNNSQNQTFGGNRNTTTNNIERNFPGPSSNRPTSPYNFGSRPQQSNTEYNKNFPPSNCPNSVQFIDDEGQDTVGSISLNPLNC